MADAWLVSILLQDSIGNEKCHLPDVRFGTVFIDLVTYVTLQVVSLKYSMSVVVIDKYNFPLCIYVVMS